MIGYLGLALLAVSARVAGTLPAETEQAVRQTVYEKAVFFGVVPRGSLGLPVVIVPTNIVEAYAKHPGAVPAPSRSSMTRGPWIAHCSTRSPSTTPWIRTGR
jgi:hypothetical protein